MRSKSLVWASALMLGGCSLAPVYHTPVMPGVPATFAETPPNMVMSAPADGAPRGAWWQAFADPVLDDLETKAAAASPTLAAALARRDEARAVLQQNTAGYLPEIDGTGSAERARAAQDRPNTTGYAVTGNDFKIGPQLTYELDLWGRVRNSVAAARDEARASDADLVSARLSLQASVADAYARLRGLDAELDLLTHTVEAYQKALDLTRRRHQGGVANGLDENRARTVLDNALALGADVTNQRIMAQHELAALVGQTASAFSLAPVPHGLSVPAVPAGTPSLLLQRRPDIAAAERRVAEANARIGVARAALYPQITLGLAAGFESTSASNLFTGPNTTWALGPLGFSVPLFDGGRRRAGVRLSRAQYDEIAANYRSTVLTAFREVEDALAGARELAREADDQRAAVTAAEATQKLAQIRYREGAADYFEVVTAQTDALTAERALLAVETRRAQASIGIVRALGGPG